MRVQHKCYVQIGLDATYEVKLFYPEDAAQTVTYDTMRHEKSGTIDVAPDTTVALSTDGVTDIRGVYLRVDSACQVRFDGGAWLDLSPATADTRSSARLFKEGLFTTIELQTPVSTVGLSGVYAVWGDPTA